MVKTVHGYAYVNGVRLHYVTAGTGTPIFIMHGFLETSYNWRKVQAQLAAHYKVIAVDIRGLGDSSRAADGYDKQTIGEDIYQLATDHFGFEKFHVLGKDLSAIAAYALAANHPEAVLGLIFVEAVLPGDSGAQGSGFSQGGARWHIAFAQEPDFPEALIQGREEVYLNFFWRNFSWNPGWITPEVEAEALRTYKTPGTFRAGLGLYRALDQDAEFTKLAITKGKLKIPVLAVGGNKGKGRGSSVADSMRRVAENVSELLIDQCGHFPCEEEPRALAEGVLDFIGKNDI